MVEESIEGGGTVHVEGEHHQSNPNWGKIVCRSAILCALANSSPQRRQIRAGPSAFARQRARIARPAPKEDEHSREHKHRSDVERVTSCPCEIMNMTVLCSCFKAKRLVSDEPTGPVTLARPSVHDVAERLGVSKGTICRAVESKAALFAAVIAWADYLELRAAAIATDVDLAVLARTIVEIITTWAVKMPWDRFPRQYPDDTAAACGTMIRHLVIGGAR